MLDSNSFTLEPSVSTRKRFAELVAFTFRVWFFINLGWLRLRPLEFHTLFWCCREADFLKPIFEAFFVTLVSKFCFDVAVVVTVVLKIECHSGNHSGIEIPNRNHY